jgi:V8-like Glu-specific endopeptidase
LNRATVQWRSSGTALSTPGTNQLRHDLDTHKSQSGSPLWLEDPATGALDLVAIHTGPSGTGTSNQAVLLTEEVLRQVKKWM